MSEPGTPIVKHALPAPHWPTADAAQRSGVETPLTRLTRLLGGGGDAASRNTGAGQRGWPGDRIRAPFANLIALTDTRGGTAPIGRVQDLAAAAFAMTNGIEIAPSPSAAAHTAGQRKLSGQSSDALSNLQALAGTLPSPVSRIISDASTRCSGRQGGWIEDRACDLGASASSVGSDRTG
jgi:hypothetical protein